ncbi:MAG TPA: thioesterase family protein [Candidatus Dormibacteraeota bacterium]|nr:thioesterase family protein [Candidatus Dormibacteraeota bacterium]
MSEASYSQSSQSGEASAAGHVFRAEVLVRFAHCDAAGIVFYPRYLEIFNDLVEDWFREKLKFPFSEIVTRRGWGLPTVHLEVDFVAPSVFGEVLSATLSVLNLGTTSITLDIVLRGPVGADRVRGRVVLVLIDRRTNRAIAIPDDLRAGILTFQAAG